MWMIGIDMGTTHTKAALFDECGRMIAQRSRATQVKAKSGPSAYSTFDPEEMWSSVADMISDLTAHLDEKSVVSIGIASMAESGLFVDRKSGRPQSPLLPWYDPCTVPQAEHIKSETDELEQFRKTGLGNSFKVGLAKMLWLKDWSKETYADCVWLSVAGYIAYQLTGKLAADYTLAARTYAFDLSRRAWDTALLRQFGLPEGVCPMAVPSGTAIGTVLPGVAERLGLSTDTSVSIAGHDHVAAAIAVGALDEGDVYNSMGTAETLVGIMQERPLGREELLSGLSYGLHPVSGRMFWMGGNPSSGGSIEWLRGIIGSETLDYSRIQEETEQLPSGPSGIVYFPYLSGSGAPTPSSDVRGAFIGLDKRHGRGDLLKSLFEGNAYQLESMRRSAEEVAKIPISRLLVIGGGVRMRPWLHVKAAVSGTELVLPPIQEATLLGAAMLGAVGAGVFGSAKEAYDALEAEQGEVIGFDLQEHVAYRQVYEERFLPIQRELMRW
ncbi:FGGY-family carbohydrate kinase [Paenibacillus faecalis]|uniref:FGGY-family carbohydrate kinase n=1 Tax=Paenibacillus faecalis TaxID=2079532 RepID=UPI000D103CDC|nr:FGGY family carbohydrate kinase [Paenibacillus faecalis]